MSCKDKSTGWRNECIRSSWSSNAVSSVPVAQQISMEVNKGDACRKIVWRAAATSFTLYRLQEQPRRYVAAKPNSVKQSLLSVQRHSTALHPGRTTKHSLSSWPTWTPGTNRQKAIYLAVSLGGPAQEILGDLDKDQRSNYKILVKALDNRFVTHSSKKMYRVFLTLEALRGGGVELTSPLRFFLAINFLLLDRLSNALSQLFLVCEHIFWH